MLLKPDQFYTVFCTAEKDVFVQNDVYKNFLTKLNEDLGSLFTIYSFCLLPKEAKLLVKSTGETDWEQFLRSKNLLQKDYNVFEEAGGMLLMGTLVQNRVSAFLKEFFPTSKAEIKNIEQTDLNTAIAKIHNSPVSQSMCSSPAEWTFSSYNAFLSDKPTRIPRQEVLDLLGGIAGFTELHK